jgi:hypothetical protein
VPSAG